jgi:acyl carrier protein phosphodiesterase
MNYLAHAYLSFNQPNILVGNMISDYVKGKTQYNYSPQILQGIKLHRAIDEFTDNHAVTKELKQFFKPQYRLYAGAFVDVVYDYFLANDKAQFATDGELSNFTKTTYFILEQNKQHFPEKFLAIFPYMIQHNWLYNYQHTWGIQKSFGGVVRRSAYLTESDIAYDIFLTNLKTLQLGYNAFFPELKTFTVNQLQLVLNEDEITPI